MALFASLASDKRLGPSIEIREELVFTRLLVPLDGSPVAEKALPHARALGRILGIPITLITVIETADDFSKKISAALDGLIEGGVEKSEQYLEKISRTFTGVAIEYRVDKGRAEEAIIVNAAGDAGTLITMATRGRSGFGRWLLGSITEKVVRGANNPVLAVRVTADTSSEGEAAMDSILVPLDGSTLAESVLPYVIELAKAFDAKVTLLRSYNLKEMIFSFEKYHPDLDQVRGALKWEAMTYLNEKVEELKSRDLVEVRSSVTEGDAAETIIETAKAAANTLIVMSPHSGSVIKHWVLGSVTDKVLRHANSSVLMIRS
jgi:nucleotide-binding universal stress UspA family protein